MKTEEIETTLRTFLSGEFQQNEFHKEKVLQFCFDYIKLLMIEQRVKNCHTIFNLLEILYKMLGGNFDYSKKRMGQ